MGGPEGINRRNNQGRSVWQGHFSQAECFACPRDHYYNVGRLLRKWVGYQQGRVGYV